MTDYNYADFVMSREDPHFLSFRDVLHVGTPAPNSELTRLSDGVKVRLSDYCKDKPVVLEFGSFT